MTKHPCHDTRILEWFLARHGLADAERRPLAGDASTRRYQRLIPKEGRSLILMQAPDPALELVPFIVVAERLRTLGLSVPDIHAVSPDDGLMLLEDFGDASFTLALDQGADPGPLYRLAVDVLIQVHRSPPPQPDATWHPPVFDAERFLSQAHLFVDMLVPGADEAAYTAFETAWRSVLPGALERPTLLLRDYHAGNLMHLPDRPGVAACGLLDFQDAGIGPAVYDLVSLIEDARRDLSPSLAASLIDQYLAAFPDLDREAFARGWAVLAALRHSRVIAVFLRLAERGKPGYLGHLPRVWRTLEGHLAHPGLAPVAAWIDRYLPAQARAGSFIAEAT